MKDQVAALIIGAGILVVPPPASACHCSQSNDLGMMGMPLSRFQAMPGSMTGSWPGMEARRAMNRRMRFRQWQARGYGLAGQWPRPPQNRYVRDYRWPNSSPPAAPAEIVSSGSNLPLNDSAAMPESSAVPGKVSFIPFDAPLSSQEGFATREVQGKILNQLNH